MKKKKISILNFIWIIPLVLGISLGFLGISKIKESNDIYVPPMGAEGWFEAETEQKSTKFTGIALCCFGFIVVGFTGTIICIAVPKVVEERKNQYKTFENIINNSIEEEKSDQSGENETDTKLKECSYCSSLVKSSATKCPSCGGKDFKNL